MAAYAHKKPHFSHTEFIIFGEDTARDGILPHLDFISRNQEFRYNTKIYIIKGNSTNSFISQTNIGILFWADMLSSIEDNAYALSQSGKVTLAEALFILSKDNVSTFLPVLVITPSKSEEDPSKGAYDIILKSYAIFKEDKLETFLDEELSKGVNWVKNRIHSGIILVEALDKQKVSLEIIQSKTSIKPSLNENELQCTISIKFNTNIAETLSNEEIFSKVGLDFLKQQQEKQVKKED